MMATPHAMPDLLLLPVPRHVERGEGTWTIPQPLTLAGQSSSPIYRSILTELRARPVAANSRAAVRLLPAEGAPEDLRPWAEDPEGYALVIDGAGARLWATEPAGHLYGAMTLRQLRRQFGETLPCLRLGDAPRLRHRGAMLSFPQGHTAYRPAYLRHLVPELARWKINTLYLYLESYFAFPSLPPIAGPGAMTADDAKELDALCRAYHITLIPQLNLMAHAGEILGLQRYHHLVECGSQQDPRVEPGFSLCACHPEVHRLVDTMLEDILACFSGEIIHVGGDEVSNLGECSRCAPRAQELGKLGLYLWYFGRIQRLLNARGRKMGIWGDMLLHYCQNAPAAESQATLAPLREGAVIYDWHYRGGSLETLRFFVQAGLETIAASGTDLCYSSSMWPAQWQNQRDLFADAIAAGALGGMTTAWLNFMGVHEEHVAYLSASGATALWSGPQGEQLAPGLTMPQFERAFSLQRYGLRSDALTRYWHILGDAKGPVLSALAPLHGANVRKCLYHTDNVLTFWKHYSPLLVGERLERYRRGVAEARAAWEQVQQEVGDGGDPYLPLQAAPLLLHEHLLKRFEMTEEVYALYDRAAQAQYVDPAAFRDNLEQAAARLLAHLADFAPVEAYLRAARRAWGLERSSILRLQATQRKMRELAAYLRHLAGSERPLPAFIQLHDVFLSTPRSHYYLDREHDWAAEPARFRRYSIENGPWTAVAAKPERE